MSDEMLPPEGGQSQNPPESVGQRAAAPEWPDDPSLDAATPVKAHSPNSGARWVRELDWRYALLGFFTPWAAGVLQGMLLGAMSMIDSSGMMSVWAAGVLSIGVFAGILVAFIMGRVRKMNRLRSFGIGGLASYVFTMLAGLLAFGACLFQGYP